MNNKNVSAFPKLNKLQAEGMGNSCNYSAKTEDGMSLRDYFAAKAFEKLVEAHINQTIDDLGKDDIGREAYSYADFMLKARGE